MVRARSQSDRRQIDAGCGPVLLDPFVDVVGDLLGVFLGGVLIAERSSGRSVTQVLHETLGRDATVGSESAGVVT